MLQSSSTSLGLTPQSRFWSEYTNPCIASDPNQDQKRPITAISSEPIDPNLLIPTWGRICRSQYGSESTNPNVGQNPPIPIWASIYQSQYGGRIYQSQYGEESTSPNLMQNLAISGLETVSPNRWCVHQSHSVSEFSLRSMS